MSDPVPASVPMSDRAAQAIARNAAHVNEEVLREAQALAQDRAKATRSPAQIQETDVIHALRYVLPPGTAIQE